MVCHSISTLSTSPRGSCCLSAALLIYDRTVLLTDERVCRVHLCRVPPVRIQLRLIRGYSIRRLRSIPRFRPRCPPISQRRVATGAPNPPPPLRFKPPQRV